MREARGEAGESVMLVRIDALVGLREPYDGLLIERATNIQRLRLGHDGKPFRQHIENRHLGALGQIHAEGHHVIVLNDENDGTGEFRRKHARSGDEQLAGGGVIALEGVE